MIKRKAYFAIGLLCFCFLLSACTSNNSNLSDGNIISTAVILNDMLDNCGELNVMNNLDYNSENAEEKFEYLYNVDYSIISDFSFTYSDAGLSDEITVVRINSSDNLTDIKQAMYERIEARKLVFDGYKPKEYDKVENAIVVDEGLYVALIISPDAKSAKKEFLAAIKNN
ncbi:MAG: DUF4358 domain-containing protein [Eubacterium sp.]